jgi:hypothetical protein
MATAFGTRVTAQQRQDWDRDGWLDYYDQRDRLLTQRVRPCDTAARISTIGHFEGGPPDEGNG